MPGQRCLAPTPMACKYIAYCKCLIILERDSYNVYDVRGPYMGWILLLDNLEDVNVDV